MFTFTEAGYQLFRNRGRSLLMLCVSLLLCGCIAFYLGNITSSQQALDSISENTPAVVNICNPYGDSMEDLSIDTVYTDLLLMNWDMKDVQLTSQAAGAYSEEQKRRDPRYFSGGDTEILGINCLKAAGVQDESRISFIEGYDSSFLEGNQPLCIVSESYAEKFGLKAGDELSLHIYSRKYSSQRLPVYFALYDGDTWGGDDYETPPEWTLRIVGTFNHKLNAKRQADMYLPVQWLRETMDEQDLPFTDYWHRFVKFSYNTFRCSLADSMRLNEFKLKLVELGFGIPFYIPASDRSDATSHTAGTAIWMEDEDFIKTAEKLAGTLRMYKAFMVPFFVVVILLVTLAVILVLRGAQRDMAVALSLGRPKKKIAAVHLIAALSAQLLGCLLALPVMGLTAGLGLTTGLAVCGAFALCALLGDLLGLWGLLRFDPLELLTKAE